jgi:hypothetical protein
VPGRLACGCGHLQRYVRFGILHGDNDVLRRQGNVLARGCVGAVGGRRAFGNRGAII